MDDNGLMLQYELLFDVFSNIKIYKDVCWPFQSS